MRGVLGFLAAAVLCGASAAALASPAEVGEKAPDLDVTSWIQGEPVVLENCVGKKIVVLEFFTSESDSAKKAIPRLSRIAERHKDHDVEVVAVSDETPEAIKAFAGDGKFKCKFACDGERNTSGPYTRLIKVREGAHAAVIDKTGVLVWKGKSAGLERIVEKVVAGKYDAEKAKKISEQSDLVDDATRDKLWDQAGMEADKLLEMDAGNEKAIVAKFKQYQESKEVAKCQAFVAAILPTIQDDFDALNSVAWYLVTIDRLSLRQPVVALKTAKLAVEKSGGLDPLSIDTLARAQATAGLLEDAIETQKKAVALDPADENLKGTLDYYLACVEARKSAAEPPK
jgi:peroxiredoxin